MQSLMHEIMQQAKINDRCLAVSQKEAGKVDKKYIDIFSMSIFTPELGGASGNATLRISSLQTLG